MKESFIEMCNKISLNLPYYKSFNCVIYSLEEANLLAQSMKNNAYITNCHIQASDDFEIADLSIAEDITNEVLIKVLKNKARESLLNSGLFSSQHNIEPKLRRSETLEDLTAVIK